VIAKFEDKDQDLCEMNFSNEELGMNKSNSLLKMRIKMVKVSDVIAFKVWFYEKRNLIDFKPI